MRRQSLPRSCALTLLRIFDSESGSDLGGFLFLGSSTVVFFTMVLQLDESTSDPDVESAGLLRNPNDDARSSAARVRRYTPISAWCCSTPLRASLVAALFTPMIVVAVVRCELELRYGGVERDVKRAKRGVRLVVLNKARGVAAAARGAVRGAVRSIGSGVG